MHRMYAVNLTKLLLTSLNVQPTCALRWSTSPGRGEKSPYELISESPVAFSYAKSTEIMSPRLAALEAFETASAGLPGPPPNFALLHVSMDHSGMLDAPEVVWNCLCKKVTSANPPVFITGAVRQQKFSGAHLELILGRIPDLKASFLTLDESIAVPDSEVKPFIALAMLDWAASCRFLGETNRRLDQLSRALHPFGAPLVGGVYPPASPAESMADVAVQFGEQNSYTQDVPSCVFFNDHVYRGAAGIAILSSELMQADVFTTIPTKVIASGLNISGSLETPPSADGSPIFKICTIDNRPAAQVLLDLLPKAPGVVYLSPIGDIPLPLAIPDLTEKDEALVAIPDSLVGSLKSFTTVDVLCDDPEQDQITSATAALQYRAATQSDCASLAKGSLATASNMAALHWTHPGQYDEHSVIKRCLGPVMPTSGVYTPGQVFPFIGAASGEDLKTDSNQMLKNMLGISSAATRSSVHVVLRPKRSM